MKARILTICVLFLAAVASVSAQQVSVNYNHSASFGQYHTYAWGTRANPATRSGTQSWRR